MSEVIVTCGCGSSHKFCLNSYKILFPDSPLPLSFVKRAVLKHLSDFPEGSEIYERLSTLAHQRGRFGYLFIYTPSGDITEVWDLMKSKRLQSC